MKFVKERVNVICQELARLSVSQKIKITDMQVKNGCYITPAEADASKEPWALMTGCLAPRKGAPPYSSLSI